MNENEAREEELHEKSYLHSSSLHWEDKETLGDDEMKRLDRVFQGLGPPHSNLKDLKILNYAGSKFPTWLEDSACSNLVKVELRGCKKCELLPGLGNLHSLEFLKIYAADEVKVVDGEFYGDGNDMVYFPKMKQLCFDSMLSWEEWKSTEGHGDVMPSLRKLKIVRCHKLKGLPDRLPSTLKEVVIEQCDEIIWMTSNPLPLLEDLRLLGNGRGIFSNGRGLEELQTISITHCYGLTSLLNGLGQFKALRNLCIIQRTKLRSLTDGLVQLEALRTVRVHDCTDMQSLFGGFEQLKALRSLDICDCPKLKPLSNLQHLTALEELKIACCPVVTEQIEKDIEEDWRNFSHITRIVIDFQRIQ
ncbi:hypothetical protein MRB53_022880 [Persea americana]|uniref:Uncharacterized protein n=1 Tax=Persea americana TaxID=3435 RepID=A0ACC2L885_PERAE|nr:hypothetical protein MRB53_022880 [Persea americana]